MPQSYSADDGRLTIRDGDVFVRLPGKTRPATSSDLGELELRHDRSPNTGAHVRVAYSESFDRVDPESIKELVKQLIDETAETLLDGLKIRRTHPAYGIALPAFANEDRRSPAAFQSSVETWGERAYGKVAEVTTEFLRHELARGRWMIHNESVRYLEAVRVHQNAAALRRCTCFMSKPAYTTSSRTPPIYGSPRGACVLDDCVNRT